jgi:Holliday junction resolvase RusA-like endonuclease
MSFWVGDVGNGILWYDDSQIVNISAVKIYGEQAKTIITVGEVKL